MFKRTQLPYNNVFQYGKNKLNYHVIGKGKPVVFVHGAFTNAYPYLAALEQLGKYNKLYIIDLPGFGGSDTIKGKKHDSNLFTHALGSFLQENDLQKVPIIALSMGVIITLKAAAQGLTQGELILIAAPGKTHSGITTQVFSRFPFHIRRAMIATNTGRRKLFLPAASANTGTGVHTADMQLSFMSSTSTQSLVDSEYLRDIKNYEKLLPSIKNKMTFIYGENDRMKHNKIAFIKEFIEIPGSGHNVFVHSPEEMVKVLRALL